MSIAKNRIPGKNPSPLDLGVPWPLNPDGFVVPQKQIESFIGNQKVIRAQITAKRFIVVVDAGRAIGRGKNVSTNWRLIRHTAGLDKSEQYQNIMKAMIEAIKQGERGIMAAYRTARYMVEYGFEYTACCNREKLYRDRLNSMLRGEKAIE